jgi:hypothetical protein
VSTILFNLALEVAMTATTTNPGGIILNRLTHCIAYADDVIIGRNINALQRIYKGSQKAGLRG